MLRKLRKRSKKEDTNSSVERRSLNSRKLRTKKFINRFKHNIKLKAARLLKDYDFKSKTFQLLKKLLDVSITGAIVWYALNYQNFFSYGLIIALETYYIDWLIKLIKGKNDYTGK